MSRKRVVDSKQSTNSKFNHWKMAFKSSTMAFEIGKLDEARTAVFRSLAEAEHLKENRDFAVAACHIGIAIISMHQGKQKEAKKYFDKGLPHLASSADPSLQELHAAGLRFLAVWHERQGDLDSAQQCLRDSIKTLSELGVDSAVQLANSLADLAFILVRQGHFEEAEPLVESAMEITRATIGREDPSYDWAKMIYQVCLNQDNRQVLADSFEESATKLMYTAGPSYPNLGRAMTVYLAALKEKGLTERYDEASEKFAFITNRIK